MWRSLLCFFAAHIFAMDPGEAVSDCPSGWTVYSRGRSCVRVYAKRMTWLQAENLCNGQGGRLAGILDEYENTFLYGVVQSANLSSPTVWLGKLNKVKGNGGSFSWSDGTPARYALGFRSEGIPSLATGCVSMWGDLGRSEGSWQIWDCDYHGYGAVCKREFGASGTVKPYSEPTHPPTTTPKETHVSRRCCIVSAHCTQKACHRTERCVPRDLNCLLTKCSNTTGWCLPN